MGMKSSTLLAGPTDSQHALAANYQLIDYVSKQFFLRRIVSQKRRRMLVGGYDLDMSYITPRILAMSFPAERMMAMYRNPMWQVKDVLEMRHSRHYKVYNLCIEEDYDPSHFDGRVERYPFDDNHVPPLPMVKEFCQSVCSWLSADPKNIAVIHCMAGKGRTGLMVSSYLVYKGMLAEEALQVYADKRTTNNLGVTIPSQRRYVNYWEKCVYFSEGCIPNVIIPKPKSIELRQIRIHDANNIETIFFTLSQGQEVPGERYVPSHERHTDFCRKINNLGHDYLYSFIHEEHKVDMSEKQVSDEKTFLDYHFDEPIQITGDVRVAFYENLNGGRFFYACFNTAFTNTSCLQFPLSELDKVGSKAKSIAGSEFRVELLFGPNNPNNDKDDCKSDL